MRRLPGYTATKCVSGSTFKEKIIVFLFRAWGKKAVSSERADIEPIILSAEKLRSKENSQKESKRPTHKKNIITAKVSLYKIIQRKLPSSVGG